MVSNKTFTAQDMREAVLKMKSFQGNRLTAIRIEQALLYAAEVLERCDWQKSHLDGLLEGKDYELAGATLSQVVKTEKSIVDYILRGDAGKEEK